MFQDVHQGFIQPIDIYLRYPTVHRAYINGT